MHPLLEATAAIDLSLRAVDAVDPGFMPCREKAGLLLQLVQLEARLVELRLRVMAGADEVAEATGARDVADWLAHHARLRPEDTRADLALATSLDRRHHGVAEALREGTGNVAQARVVTRTLDDLPREVGLEVTGRAERVLVGYCSDFGPRQLHQLGHRVLETIAPDIAEQTEAKRLLASEAEARRRTRLSLRACGDGTTRLTGLIPDASAHRLKTYLGAFTNPRKANAESAEADQPDTTTSYPHKLGTAFVEFLETIDPDRLPVHGGDATTVIVTIPFASLKEDLATADLLGAEERISAAQARRLACNAALIPAVLGAASEILDLGRRQRLFNAAQQRALRLRDQTCRAEGCTIPGTWAEAHHWVPCHKAGRPTSPTAYSSAATTTTSPTTLPTPQTATSMAASGSADADRRQLTHTAHRISARPPAELS